MCRDPELDPARVHALALEIQYWPSRSLDLALPRASSSRGSCTSEPILGSWVSLSGSLDLASVRGMWSLCWKVFERSPLFRSGARARVSWMVTVEGHSIPFPARSKGLAGIEGGKWKLIVRDLGSKLGFLS